MKKLLFLFMTIPVLLLSCNKEDAVEKRRAHKAVDLGLSVLWADTNIGAEEEYNFGWYFAWGATQHNFDYWYWSNYPYAETDEDGDLSKLTKYEKYPPYNLELSDDAARQLWGHGWRMPTKAEVNELFTSSLVEYRWMESYSISGEDPKEDEYFQKPISGISISNIETGERIFLPCAMARHERTGFFSNPNGKTGYYWTSDISQRNERLAYTMVLGMNLVWSDKEETYVEQKYIKLDELLRCYGHSIRPVKDRPKK